MTGFIITGFSIIWTWVAFGALNFAAKIPQNTYTQLNMSELPLMTELAFKISTGWAPLVLAITGTLFLLILHIKTSKENIRYLVQNIYLGFWIIYTNFSFIAFLVPFWIPVVQIE